MKTQQDPQRTNYSPTGAIHILKRIIAVAETGSDSLHQEDKLGVVVSFAQITGLAQGLILGIEAHTPTTPPQSDNIKE